MYQLQATCNEQQFNCEFSLQSCLKRKPRQFCQLMMLKTVIVVMCILRSHIVMTK